LNAMFASILKGRHDNQHNDILHKGHSYDTQHK
jgi:hypothetical protein